MDDVEGRGLLIVDERSRNAFVGALLRFWVDVWPAEMTLAEAVRAADTVWTAMTTSDASEDK